MCVCKAVCVFLYGMLVDEKEVGILCFPWACACFYIVRVCLPEFVL